MKSRGLEKVLFTSLLFIGTTSQVGFSVQKQRLSALQKNWALN